MIPFVFCLMTHKSEKCYTHLFQYIRDNIINLEGNSFMTDFEKSMRNALRKIFPNIKYYNCWFHFCQAVIRKCKAIPGFLNFVRSSPQLNQLLHKFLVLPLLPAEKIKEAFALLKLEAALVNRNLFAEFISYFEKQWIVRVSSLFF